MDLLVTLDQNYLGPLRVLLGSLFLNDPGEEFHIYMIEEGLTGAQVEELSQLCRAHHSQLHPLEVPDGLFTDAPVVRYYSRAMYYRLLAAELLPRELDRVLYLDPDHQDIRVQIEHPAPGTGQGALSGPGYPGDPAGAAPV